MPSLAAPHHASKVWELGDAAHASLTLPPDGGLRLRSMGSWIAKKMAPAPPLPLRAVAVDKLDHVLKAHAQVAAGMRAAEKAADLALLASVASPGSNAPRVLFTVANCNAAAPRRLRSLPRAAACALAEGLRLAPWWALALYGRYERIGVLLVALFSTLDFTPLAVVVNVLIAFLIGAFLMNAMATIGVALAGRGQRKTPRDHQRRRKPWKNQRFSKFNSKGQQKSKDGLEGRKGRKP